MNYSSSIIRGNGGPLLLLSMRRLSNLVAYSMLYEFEDIVTDITGADRIEVDNPEALEFSRRAYKLIRKASGSATLAQKLAPPPSVIRLDRQYDLFFPVFNHPHELHALAAVPNWRDHCRVGICYINEVWVHLLPEYLLEQLSRFDHIFLAMHHAVDAVARITGRPCSQLPLAADVARFSPWPAPLVRNIDVCNVGRRSALTHEVLLRLGADRRIFYYYDTYAGSADKDKRQRTFRVDQPAQHRLLMANVLQRSRYYIANRARFNESGYPEIHQESSGRFYEGIAAGTVILGSPPDTPEFRRQFNWPDAVIHIPSDHPGIEDTLNDLDREPERLSRIHRENTRHAALRHDWVYRLEDVFRQAGIAPTEGMLRRKQLLQELGGQIIRAAPDIQRPAGSSVRLLRPSNSVPPAALE